MQGTLIAAQLACAVAFTFVGIPQYIDRNNEVFKELNHYARHCQWDKITDKCENMPMNNLLFQNYHNVALAEQGLLADQLFMQPCIDIQTIYVPGNKTPYLSALLSDIYFSMGHIAFSQRYAFEANEGMGNFSPRMLQRLVQTSLIYGHYGTAKKYLDILESTLFYKDWATAHRRFLWNDPAVETDSILGSKRKCLFPDNPFLGHQRAGRRFKANRPQEPHAQDHHPVLRLTISAVQGYSTVQGHPRNILWHTGAAVRAARLLSGGSGCLCRRRPGNIGAIQHTGSYRGALRGIQPTTLQRLPQLMVFPEI